MGFLSGCKPPPKPRPAPAEAADMETRSLFRAGAGEPLAMKKKLKGVQGAEDGEETARPVGGVVKVSKMGAWNKRHYASFEWDGSVFELEDTVLMFRGPCERPLIAIIKDITEDVDGNLMVTGQWFYRPEETEKRGGGNWQVRDNREIYYTFHHNEVRAESVMHKCVVHFVPLNKRLPDRFRYPGFIVQNIYDPLHKKLWDVTDKNYEDSKQHEVGLLVQKTCDRLGELLDIDAEASPGYQDDQNTSGSCKRKRVLPVDALRVQTTREINRFPQACIPGTSREAKREFSEYHIILKKFRILTGDKRRDLWLEKLLQRMQQACNMGDDMSAGDKQKVTAAPLNYKSTDKEGALTVVGCKDTGSQVDIGILWPDSAIVPITILERVAHENFGTETQRYNVKMRQLDFNLKNNLLLARRLLSMELDPMAILCMSPDELKDGSVAENKGSTGPEKSMQMQMMEAQCSRCLEKKVGVAEIIHAGGFMARYQLECIACGHTWYASSDDAICSI